MTYDSPVTRRSGRESKQARQARANAVMGRLRELYPEAGTSLHAADPFQLLVATILSAQCTDARVNLVTPALFRRFPDAHALAAAPAPELEDLIRSTGFFRNKAKNLIGASRALVREHGGSVPDSMEALLALPGVARKTANCVLGAGFGRAVGIVVDTHVGRLARRMGFTRATDPVRVEQDLMELFPRADWIRLSHAWIHHGRAVCTARQARCSGCALRPWCLQRGVPADSRRRETAP